MLYSITHKQICWDSTRVLLSALLKVLCYLFCKCAVQTTLTCMTLDCTQNQPKRCIVLVMSCLVLSRVIGTTLYRPTQQLETQCLSTKHMYTGLCIRLAVQSFASQCTLPALITFSRPFNCSSKGTSPSRSFLASYVPDPNSGRYLQAATTMLPTLSGSDAGGSMGHKYRATSIILMLSSGFRQTFSR